MLDGLRTIFLDVAVNYIGWQSVRTRTAGQTARFLLDIMYLKKLKDEHVVKKYFPLSRR